MDLKEVEKECMSRQGTISAIEQKLDTLDKQVDKLEKTLSRVTAYFIITLLGISGFFIKLYMSGGVKK